MESNELLKRAKDYLIWLLSRRDYPKARLLEKLKGKGLSPEDSETLLQDFEVKGYYLESRYQRQRVKQLVNKGHGPALIRAKLRVDKINIDQKEILELHDDLGTSPVEVLKVLALKHLAKLQKKDLSHNELKTKLFRFLLSKGHSSSDIQIVLKEIL